MALVLNFNACQTTGCSELTFSDQTGAYNATTNPTGYYPPPGLASVVSATLVITAPDLVTYTVNLLTTTYFPNSNPNFQYVIPASQIGGRTNIEDGQWTFKYTVTYINLDDEELTVSTTKSYIFTCNSTCCVSRLKAKINVRECDSYRENNKNTMNFLKAEAFLESLKYAAFCNNLTEYTTIKNILDKLCTNTGCKTCR
jgi:hypothetical protein